MKKHSSLKLEIGATLHQLVNVKVTGIETVEGVTTIELEFDQNKNTENYMQYAIAIIENDYMIVNGETADIITEMYSSLEELVSDNLEILNYEENEENEKIYEIEYEGTYNTGFCYESDLELFKQFEGFDRHVQMTECRRCGKQTTQLEIVNNLPSCKTCGEKSEQAMKRAYEYMASDLEY